MEFSNLGLVTLALYIGWNFFVFLLYGIDKRKAKRGSWRISEANLIMAAFLMGGVGALFGMKVFRHKTAHAKFTVGVPAAILFNAAVVAGIWFVCTR